LQVKALYRGIGSPVTGFGVCYAFSFSGYGFAVRWIKERSGMSDAQSLSYAQMTLAGAFAGMMQSPARQIFERVKSVMQIRERQGGLKPYSWSGECFVQLIKTEGVVNGLFRGMTATFMREVPQFAVYYPVVRARCRWRD
jgi:solute carrier family 25 carnitine/acylcarnitine transporter 20/29